MTSIRQFFESLPNDLLKEETEGNILLSGKRIEDGNVYFKVITDTIVPHEVSEILRRIADAHQMPKGN